MKRAYGTYVCALVLFGTNGIVASLISAGSSEIVFLRTFVASLALVAVLGLTRRRPGFLDHPRQALFAVLSGVALGASWLFLYEAYRQIGVGMASLAYYCGPIIVMALSPLVFREKLTAPKLVGFGTVIAGVLLVNGQALQEGGAGWGLMCGALSAVLYAAMVICSKKADGIDGLENATLQLVAACAVSAGFVAASGGFPLAIAAGDWLPLLMLGLVNTALGCFWYFSAMGKLPVQSVAVCGYLEPLSAVVFSAVLLGEAMAPVQVLGAVLMLAGAVFGECAGTRRGMRRAGGPSPSAARP